MLSFFLLAGLTVLLLAVALFLFLKSKAFAGGMTLIAVGLSGYVSFLALETNIKPQIEEKNQIAAEEREKSLARAKAAGKDSNANGDMMMGSSAAAIDSMEDMSPEAKKEAKRLLKGTQNGETFNEVAGIIAEGDAASEAASAPKMGKPTMPAAGR